MKNVTLILLILTISSCSRWTKFRQDKIQFSDKQSLSEKKALKSIVSGIFEQDTFVIKYRYSDCDNFIGMNFNVSTIDDPVRLTCDTAELDLLMIGGFIYEPNGGIANSIQKNQLDSMKKLAVKYGSRQYKMYSTSYKTYEFVGADTSILIDNYYYFEGNPLDQFQRLLEIKKIKTMAIERSQDSLATEIYWSYFD